MFNKASTEAANTQSYSLFTTLHQQLCACLKATVEKTKTQTRYGPCASEIHYAWSCKWRRSLAYYKAIKFRILQIVFRNNTAIVMRVHERFQSFSTLKSDE